MALKDAYLIKEAAGKEAGVPTEIYRIMSECEKAGVVEPGARGTIFSALVDAWSWGKFGRRWPTPKSQSGETQF